jgi:S1-C subfamily serine protease
MSAEFVTLSNAFAAATEKTARHTVAVHAEARGSSSGVIWRPGVIVAAEHTLSRDEEIQVTLPDGRVVAATLAGRDPSTDLALLKCPEASAGISALGDTGTLKAGNLALVVGRTRVSGPVAALGFLSLVAGERRMWGGTKLTPYVRLDVALQPTAIGGAVVDAHENVVGIATPRFARFGVIAIPTATVSSVADALLEKGYISRGYLGVGLQPVRLPEQIRQKLTRAEKAAAIVLEVQPDGPAHKAGVLIGDILVTLAGKPITRLEDVQEHLYGETIGKSVEAKFVRGGELRETNIVIGERKDGVE